MPSRPARSASRRRRPWGSPRPTTGSARKRRRFSSAYFDPAAVDHNGGPPLDDKPRTRGFVHYCWRRAHRAAWRNPGYEIMARRLKRAEEPGMSYREYTAVILDRGVYL